MKTTQKPVLRPRAFAAAAVALSLAAAAHAASYHLVDLGVPDGASASSATAVNLHGDVTVNATVGGNSFAYYYDGSLHAIPSVGSPTSSESTALNDNGLFVGTLHYADSPTARGFIYNANTDALTTFGSTFDHDGYGNAISVNNAGITLGGAGLYAPGGYTYTGGVYTGLDSETLYLGGYGALNNANQVLTSSSSLQSFYLHQLGAISDAGTDLLNWNVFHASDFNDNGTIAGYDYANHNLFLTTNTHLDTADYGKIGLGISSVGDVNNLNDVVGTYDAGGMTTGAFLFSNGTFADLNTLISPALGWNLFAATGINDNGQIVGTGWAPDGSQHAFRLDPDAVPEPSTYGLMGAVGLLGLGIYRRKRRKP